MTDSARFDLDTLDRHSQLYSILDVDPSYCGTSRVTYIAEQEVHTVYITPYMLRVIGWAIEESQPQLVQGELV